MRRRGPSAIACGVLLLLALPAVVRAQFNYTTNDGTITITGYTGAGGAVTIPGTITGRPVTSIGNYAFFPCTTLTSVSIHNNVTSFGAGAFWGCSSLTNVTIGNGVTSIAEYAFNSCGSLTSVAIPYSVTTIGDGPFQSCTRLTAITVDALNPRFSSVDGVLLEKSQTELVEYPRGKSGSYTIPDSVTSIRGGAFYYCTSLTAVTIPNSVTRIGISAFSLCSTLTSLTIPDSVTSIGDDAFGACRGVTNVTIGNKVTSIGNDAFGDCTSLSDVSIPNSVTNIGYNAFIYCTNLINVTMGNNVAIMGGGMFGNCSNLQNVYFRGSAPNIGWDLFDSDSGATVYYLPGTMGWGLTFGGRPTALWLLPNPLILSSGSGFGVRTNRFGFIISWATNVPVVVEASTTLIEPTWSPVATNTLNGGSSYFSDAEWANHPGRYYRIRSP